MKKAPQKPYFYQNIKFFNILAVLLAFVCLFPSCSNKKSTKSQTQDINIFSLTGHPTYYDSVEMAKAFWKDYLGEQVILPGSYENYESGKTLIFTEGYGSNNTLLTNIELCFSNSSVGTVALESALNIAKEYLPIEMMRQYYFFDCSYILSDTDKEKNESFLYIVHYSITDKGSEHREQTKQDVYTMPYEIYIKLFGSATNIDVVQINDNLDNSYWEINYERNGFMKMEWEYDFLSDS